MNQKLFMLIIALGLNSNLHPASAGQKAAQAFRKSLPEVIEASRVQAARNTQAAKLAAEQQAARALKRPTGRFSAPNQTKAQSLYDILKVKNPNKPFSITSHQPQLPALAQPQPKALMITEPELAVLVSKPNVSSPTTAQTKDGLNFLKALAESQSNNSLGIGKTFQQSTKKRTQPALNDVDRDHVFSTTRPGNLALTSGASEVSTVSTEQIAREVSNSIPRSIQLTPEKLSRIRIPVVVEPATPLLTARDSTHSQLQPIPSTALALNQPLETIVKTTDRAPLLLESGISVAEITELAQSKPIQTCLEAMAVVLQEQGTSNTIKIFIDPVQQQIGFIAGDVKAVMNNDTSKKLCTLFKDFITSPVIIDARKTPAGFTFKPSSTQQQSLSQQFSSTRGQFAPLEQAEKTGQVALKIAPLSEGTPTSIATLPETIPHYLKPTQTPSTTPTNTVYQRPIQQQLLPATPTQSVITLQPTMPTIPPAPQNPIYQRKSTQTLIQQPAVRTRPIYQPPVQQQALHVAPTPPTTTPMPLVQQPTTPVPVARPTYQRNKPQQRTTAQPETSTQQPTTPVPAARPTYQRNKPQQRTTAQPETSTQQPKQPVTPTTTTQKIPTPELPTPPAITPKTTRWVEQTTEKIKLAAQYITTAFENAFQRFMPKQKPVTVRPVTTAAPVAQTVPTARPSLFQKFTDAMHTTRQNMSNKIAEWRTQRTTRNATTPAPTTRLATEAEIARPRLLQQTTPVTRPSLLQKITDKARATRQNISRRIAAWRMQRATRHITPTTASVAATRRLIAESEIATASRWQRLRNTLAATPSYIRSLFSQRPATETAISIPDLTPIEPVTTPLKRIKVKHKTGPVGLLPTDSALEIPVIPPVEKPATPPMTPTELTPIKPTRTPTFIKPKKNSATAPTPSFIPKAKPSGTQPKPAMGGMESKLENSPSTPIAAPQQPMQTVQPSTFIDQTTPNYKQPERMSSYAAKFDNKPVNSGNNTSTGETKGNGSSEIKKTAQKSGYNIVTSQTTTPPAVPLQQKPFTRLDKRTIVQTHEYQKTTIDRAPYKLTTPSQPDIKTDAPSENRNWFNVMADRLKKFFSWVIGS